MNCPELVSNFCNPAIKWYQTDLTVVISIQLTDVSNYYLRIENGCLQFSTEVNSKKYYLILNLFGAVVAEKTVHKNLVREIKIYLIKALKWWSWLRLTKLKEKNPLILYDPERIQETNHIRNTYDIGRFERYKREHNLSYIMPVVPSSDEEESDDENYMDFLHYG